MKQTRLSFFLFAVFLTLLAVESSGQHFDEARESIKAVPPSDMDYNTFCNPLSAGRYKTACRLKTVPDVGLLVCHALVVEGLPCDTMITGELNTLKELEQNDITIVSFDPTDVDQLRCGKSADLTCTGYLVGWVDPQQGWFEHLSNYFLSGTVDTLINRVKGRVPETALPTTAEDFKKIKSFMEFPVSKRYRQICDLQGFFLYSGGFLVNDPDGILENMGLKDYCYSMEYPTTEKVLKGLEKMISAFS